MSQFLANELHYTPGDTACHITPGLCCYRSRAGCLGSLFTAATTFGNPAFWGYAFVAGPVGMRSERDLLKAVARVESSCDKAGTSMA